MVPRRVQEAMSPPREEEVIAKSLLLAGSGSRRAVGSGAELVTGSDGSGIRDCWPAAGASLPVKTPAQPERRPGQYHKPQPLMSVSPQLFDRNPPWIIFSEPPCA